MMLSALKARTLESTGGLKETSANRAVHDPVQE